MTEGVDRNKSDIAGNKPRIDQGSNLKESYSNNNLRKQDNSYMYLDNFSYQSSSVRHMQEEQVILDNH
jgi:hypothetical protein